MTISNTYTFTVNRDEIIRQAMLYIGKLGEGDNPSAQEVTDCSRILNMMCKQWMGSSDFAPGLKMWTRKRGDLFLSASTGQYSLGPSGDNWTATSYSRNTTAQANAGASSITVSSIANATNGDFIGIVLANNTLFWTTINGTPSGATINLASTLPSTAASGAYVYNYTTKQQRPIQIETVVLRDVNNNDVPVTPMTLEQYEALPSKVNPSYISLPSNYYYESQLTNGVLYIDVAGVSDVTYRLHIVYLNPVSDFTTALDNPEYSQQWYMALCWGLALNICPMYNAPWTQEMQLCYTSALAMAREQDGAVSSLYFTPG